MSIHKAQGQSLEKVGVDLTESVFCHGQLYVALSRATSQHGVKILTPARNPKTRNIVDPRAVT